MSKYTDAELQQATIADHWLKRARIMEYDIRDCRDQIAILKEQARSAGAVFGGIRAQTTSDKVGNAVAAIMREVDTLEEMIVRKQHLRETIRRAIDAVPDLTLRRLLMQRYLLYRTWEQAAEAMDYDAAWLAHKRVPALLSVKLPWQEMEEGGGNE